MRLLKALPVAAILLASCQLKSVVEDIPTEPSPVPTAQPTPIVLPTVQPQIPGPAPTPSPSESPTPEPSATPTPQPTPTQPPNGSCNLPPSNGDNSVCNRETGAFLDTVERGLDRVIVEQPSLFNLNDKNCHNCYKVRDEEGYADAMVAMMRRAGLCARYDGEELQLKNANSFSEQYDILTAEGYIRRGPGAYRVTCRPAAF
jgi:hypothetical protein